MTRHGRARSRIEREENDPVDSRIVWIEVIGYSSVIGLIALIATGWFDVMLPWTS